MGKCLVVFEYNLEEPSATASRVPDSMVFAVQKFMQPDNTATVQ